MVGMMFRAGVPLLAGTDAMNPYCLPGFSLHDELVLVVQSGLTPLAALQAATLNPAEFLGRSDELGGIAPGKRADLVLLTADPLADIHNTTQIQAVWLRGKYLDRAALDQLLAAAKHRRGKSKLD
jgi:imidazolonepropionase-like amidohydrolase